MSLSKTNKLLELVPTKYPHVFDVKLNLEYQTRFIGKVDTSGEGTFITNRKEKHLFRKTNSLGINYSLLTDESIPFKCIVINYNGKGLVTTRNYYLKKGKAFQFSKKNFELQLFVPLPELNRKTAEQFEQSNGKQDDLFAVAV